MSFRDFVDSFEQLGVKSLHELVDRYDRKVAQLEAQLTATTEDRDLWQNAHDNDCPNKNMLETVEAQLRRKAYEHMLACQVAEKAMADLTEAQAQLRQEREAHVETKRELGDAVRFRNADEQAQATNGPWEVKPLRDYQWAICAPDGEVLCVSNKESFTRQVARLQTTISQLREAVEVAFAAKIHPFQTDETRDYCQCGYYKTHPIHTLAQIPKEKIDAERD